jgi:lipid A ethanolaminephosphotransferase
MRKLFIISLTKNLASLFNTKTISYNTANVLLAIFLTALYNDSLWLSLYKIVGIHNASSIYFYFAFFVLATAVCFLLLTITALLPWHKYSLITLVVSAAMGSYFIEQYGVYIDSGMITNVLQTDRREALELFTPSYLLHFTVYALIPAFVLYRLDITQDHSTKGLIKKTLMSLTGLIMALALCLPSYQTLASVMRTHKEIRYLVTPSNIVYGVAKAVSESEKITQQVSPLDDSAHLNELWKQPSEKPLLFVLIVGETARAANFSLSKYARNTNPNLASKDIIYFPNVSACGTSTAVSLPCMFAAQQRANFSRKAAAASENLLDLIDHAGLDVAWIDNNSGCKGVCVRTRQIPIANDPANCDSEHCFDMVMLQALDQPDPQDQVIVMHQQGSHGPAYYKQVPEEAAQFTPTCKTSQLQDCSHEQIVNAYDNTILYTDLFVSKVIERLDELSKTYHTAVIYLSDHGESLGEKGIYLHAAPYFMAPSEQVGIPMLAWLSDSFAERFDIEKECLKRDAAKPISHDNLFSSILGMLSIESTVYDPAMDIFRNCKHQS